VFFVLGTFSTQANVEQELIGFQPQDCETYANEASEQEYFAYTPFWQVAAHLAVSYEFFEQQLHETYSEWYDFCIEAEGSAGFPTFL